MHPSMKVLMYCNTCVQHLEMQTVDLSLIVQNAPSALSRWIAQHLHNSPVCGRGTEGTDLGLTR